MQKLSKGVDSENGSRHDYGARGVVASVSTDVRVEHREVESLERSTRRTCESASKVNAPGRPRQLANADPFHF